ncbi:hypothetical protein ACG5V6_13060 [Streptomyces chitinivorans]|uniref:Uncharacterized protein n=1 Tax=Streptomyces chitinivorans TaxID=1257027 RepID=A0ABW7HU74_9ACTN|nr:hypothetical protein [Streptomyces chitinivorans]MDH2412228.1 hypothetical protein [Streptomyces chitinivorans]
MTAALVVGGTGYTATEILNHSTRYVPPPEPAPSADDDLYGGSERWRALCEGKATLGPEPGPDSDSEPGPAPDPSPDSDMQPDPSPDPDMQPDPSPDPSGDGRAGREVVMDTLVWCPEEPLDWRDRLGEWR